MGSTTRIIWCFTFLNFLVFVQCAPELPAEDSYGIISTEWAIRNTVNNLFSTLKLKVMQNRLESKQYSRIHNFFVSITLRNHNSLEKIAKLTEVDNIDNGTQVFITQLNEVLNEDNKSDEETDSVYVTFLIEDFINRLDHLKDRHDLKNNTKNFDLNKAIVRYFNKKEFGNTPHSKEEFAKRNDSNDSLLSDNEFWHPSGRRIFQGVGSGIKRYPFMASVQFFRMFQCSGSIIKSDLIITSASCLQIAWNNRFFRENPLFLSVQVGSNFSDHGGEHISVMEIYYHPGFEPKTLRHNLAIMRLERAVKFRKKQRKVKKIVTDTQPWPLPSNVDGVVIVGWGVKTFAGTIVKAAKNKLSAARLDFYPLDECQEIYSKEFVTDRNFCAGFYSKGGGACNHDAGGPGVVGGILTGVISFGAPVCGTVDAPTVFTKLGYYTDWIEGIMEMELPTVKQQTTLRSVNRPTFHLPSVTKKTTMKIMPFVKGLPYKKPSGPNVIRTNDEIHEFGQFLKTFFKEKKEQKTLEKETEEATESSYESEVTDSPHETQEVTDSPHETQEVTDSPHETQEVTDSPHETQEVTDSPHETQEVTDSPHETQEVTDSPHETQEVTDFPHETQEVTDSPHETQEVTDSPHETQEVTDSPHETQEVTDSPHTTPHVTDSPDKTQKVKEIHKFKVKPMLRKKPNTNLKNKWSTESQNQSKDNSEDKTSSIRTSTIFGSEKYNLFSENDSSSAEAPNSEEKITTSFTPLVDLNEEASTSQDTEFDEIIESLLDTINIDFESNPDLTDRHKHEGKKTRIEVKLKEKKKKETDSNKRGDKEYYNKKDDSTTHVQTERDEENSSNDYKNENEQSDNNPKLVTKASKKRHSTDTQENEDSEEVVHTVHKTNKNKRYKTGDKGKTDEEYKTMSIPAESSEQENSSSNTTDRLIDMLEYEDIYKLLSV